ncbi:MAG: hypothetical protein QOF86_4466 [Baekduia sp.]|nr:hypothetical protein [Baekduia sp.]MEA2279977.1 hypothetical protein [Solirubrobacteraceae bacterium]
MRVASLAREPAAAEAVLSARRALTALGAGAVVGVLAALLGAPDLGPVIAWVVAAGLALLWAWRLIWPLDHAGTRRLAEYESASRTTDAAVLIASVISVGAVALALVTSSSGGAGVAVALLSVVSAVLSWCLVNTVFALKYAREYYLGTNGGIDFRPGEEPAYADFAYLAFTIGMAFAVSDTELASTQLRRIALGHALISYAFGTGILAVAINVVTNLSG